MAIENFDVGDTVWRTGSFQKMRIVSIDNRGGTAKIGWMDHNGHRIVSPIPVSLAKLTKANPRLADTGPLPIPPQG